MCMLRISFKFFHQLQRNRLLVKMLQLVFTAFHYQTSLRRLLVLQVNCSQSCAVSWQAQDSSGEDIPAQKRTVSPQQKLKLHFINFYPVLTVKKGSQTSKAEMICLKMSSLFLWEVVESQALKMPLHCHFIYYSFSEYIKQLEASICHIEACPSNLNMRLHKGMASEYTHLHPWPPQQSAKQK